MVLKLTANIYWALTHVDMGIINSYSSLHCHCWFSKWFPVYQWPLIALLNMVQNASGLITKSLLPYFILLPRQQIGICFRWTQTLLFSRFSLHLPFTLSKERLCQWYHPSNPIKSTSFLWLWVFSLLCSFIHSFIGLMFPENIRCARCYSRVKSSSEQTGKAHALTRF